MSGFQFFYQFLTVLTNFQFLCCLAGFVISKQVFNDFKHFGTVFGSKNSSFCQKILFCCLVMENSFQAVFSVLEQILTFLTNF